MTAHWFFLGFFHSNFDFAVELCKLVSDAGLFVSPKSIFFIQHPFSYSKITQMKPRFQTRVCELPLLRGISQLRGQKAYY